LIIHADGNANRLSIGETFGERLAILVETTVDKWLRALSNVCEATKSVLVVHADGNSNGLSITEAFSEGSRTVIACVSLVDLRVMRLLTSLRNAHNKRISTSIGTTGNSDDISVVNVKGLTNFLAISQAFGERSLGDADDKGIGTSICATGDSDDISVMDVEGLTNLLPISQAFGERLLVLSVRSIVSVLPVADAEQARMDATGGIEVLDLDGFSHPLTLGITFGERSGRLLGVRPVVVTLGLRASEQS
jgi:hypothetical protein